MLKGTYFEISENLRLFKKLDRWLNPYKNIGGAELRGGRFDFWLTKRAGRRLLQQPQPLILECQLYFSCVVKKRVLFHEGPDQEAIPVTEKIGVKFRTVEPTACDPEEFANNYPEKRELNSKGANRMRLKEVRLDYRDDQWEGEFRI